MNAAKVTARVLAGLDHRCALRGLDAVRIGRRHGLDEPVWNDPDAEIPLVAFAGLMASIGDACADPDATRALGRAYDLRRFGDMGLATLASDSLGEALRRFVENVALLQDASEVSLHVGETHAAVRYRVLDPDVWPRREDARFTLGVFEGIVDRFVERPGACTRHVIGVDAERGDGSRRPTGPDAFDACAEASELRFPARWLERRGLPDPSPPATPCLAELEARLAASRRARLRDTPFAERVRTVLLRRLGRERIDQTSVAAELCTTRRTLRRRLADESTGWNRVLHECRFAVARRDLVRTAHPFATIAARTGYSEQSAFTRAFALEHGMSPREYRRRSALDADAPPAPFRESGRP